MEKTITVEKLIEKYNELNNKNSKEAYLKATIKTVDYLDVTVLDVIATAIVNASSFDKDGNLNIDSFKRFILLSCAYINNCTNIEIDSNNWTAQYDLLKKNGIFDIIYDLISPEVITDIQTIVNMKVDDLLTNYQMKRYDKIAYMPESLILSLEGIIEKYNDTLTTYLQNNQLEDNNV